MSDILAVLDEQTTQTEALIDQLSDRLARTQKLKQLEIERRKTEARVTVLESRLRDIETELAHLRQQATCFDPARLKTATVHLDQVWQSSAFGVETPVGIPASRPAPVTPIRPVEPTPDKSTEPDTARPALAAEVAEVEAARPEPASTSVIAPLNADDVLGSFFLGDGGSQWATPAATSFFSAAQELGGETDLDDWWQDDPAAPPPPAQDYLTDDFGFGLPLSQPAPELAGAMMMEPAAVAPNGGGRKKGLLGRFF